MKKMIETIDTWLPPIVAVALGSFIMITMLSAI